MNYSSKFKIINKIRGKKRGKENNVKNLDNNKNTITKNEESKELNNRSININSYESKSSLSFSINKSNLADLNKSSDKSKENIKAKENMLFIKKNFDPEEYETKIKDIEKEKRNISYYKDDSEINGNAFENDSIHYICKKLYSVAKNNDCSIIYNIEPNIENINSIFKGNNKLYTLDKIQLDFIILNLKIADLIEFLIENYSIIHSNSKLEFAFKNKKFFTLEDLNSLKEDNKFCEERIDIIGESGVNIINEEEKCSQLLKYSKLIHNINYLIKENNTEDLINLLDLLYLNSNNKKLILFITNGTHSNFVNSQNNKFLQLQKKLSVDSLLIYRNKKLLYRTIFIDKLIKKFIKEGKKIFDDNNEKQFKKIIKESLESPYYEKVVKKLSKIEKKIKYIKTGLFDYFSKKNIFIELCNDVMYTIKDKYIKPLSKENIEMLKNKLDINNDFKEFKEINEANSETVDKKIYILNTEKNMEEKVEKIINKFKENNKNNKNNIKFEFSNDLNILYEKKSNIFKIIILFVNESFFTNLDNYGKINNLKNELQINKFNPIILYIKNKEMETSFNQYKDLLGLNFNCINNDNQLQNAIDDIISNKYNIDLYQKFNDIIKEEKYYKYIINRYINIFNKTIFGFKKEKYEKYEKIFIKISQDLQFLQNFDFDYKNIIDDETKNKIIDIIKDKDIKILIDNFLEEKKILEEINKALIEFEEDIVKIKKAKNGNKIPSNIKFSNLENNNINENISAKISENMNNENKIEFIPNNNKSIDKNKIEEKSNNESNIEENDLAQLELEISECEKILNDSDSKQKIETKIGKEEQKEYKYLILNALIKDNMVEIIKNEILIVVYVVLQKSIIHQFEKEFKLGTLN